MSGALDVGEQELLQTRGAGVLDDAQSSAPKTLGAVEFYGCGEQHLAQRTAPRYAWFRAAQEGLIDLHIAGEPVPSWTHHDRPVAVQHRPRRSDTSRAASRAAARLVSDRLGDAAPLPVGHGASRTGPAHRRCGGR